MILDHQENPGRSRENERKITLSPHRYLYSTFYTCYKVTPESWNLADPRHVFTTFFLSFWNHFPVL